MTVEKYSKPWFYNNLTEFPDENITYKDSLRIMEALYPTPLNSSQTADVNGSFTGPTKVTGDGIGIVKENLDATSAPTSTDDADSGYTIGSPWIDQSTNTIYFCADATPGEAVWMAAATSSVTTVFGRTGDIDPKADDYKASLITNDSDIPGDYVKQALNNQQNLQKFADAIITTDKILDPNRAYAIDSSAGALTETVNNDMSEGDIVRFILTGGEDYNTVTIDKQDGLPSFFYSQDTQASLTFGSGTENAIVTIYHSGTYLITNMSSSGEFFGLNSNDATDVDITTEVPSTGYLIDFGVTEVNTALEKLNMGIGQISQFTSIDRLDETKPLVNNIINVLKYAKDKRASIASDTDGAGVIHIYSDSNAATASGASVSSLPVYEEKGTTFLTKKIITFPTHTMNNLTVRFKMKGEISEEQTTGVPSYVKILVQNGDSQSKTLRPVSDYQEISMSLDISTMEGAQTFEFQIHGVGTKKTLAKDINLYLE